MDRIPATLVAITALALAAAPALAGTQAGEAVFAFDGSTLTVRLEAAGAPGVVRLADGAAGRVRVTDLTGAGDPALRLAGSALSIVHRGDGPARYRVTVPAGAAVTVHLDRRRLASIAPADGGRELAWRWTSDSADPGAEPGRVASGEGDAGRVMSAASTRMGTNGPRHAPAPPSRAVGPRQQEPPVPVVAPRPPRHTFAVNAFSGEVVVDSIDLAWPERVRTLRIVVGARNLRVSGDRSVAFGFHEPSRWGVITPRVDEAGITLELPAGVGSFKLRVAGEPIWVLRDGRGDALCEPVARIQRPDGTVVWVFNPRSGAMECESGPGPIRPA
jgi:hypothetical protein